MPSWLDRYLSAVMDVVFANGEVIDRLSKTGLFNGMCMIKVPESTTVDGRVSTHTDLSVYADEKIYCAPSVYEVLYGQLTACFGALFCEKYLIKGNVNPGKKYPEEVAYNVLKLKAHMFHRLDVTEQTILDGSSHEKIAVKQGYSRCSCMPIGDTAIITEDLGLGRVVAEKGYDVLYIERGHVVLNGYPYGFFGGVGGRIGDRIVLNGQLSRHPDGEKIKTFIRLHGFKIVELHAGQLYDCGSVLHYYRNEE